MWKGVVVLVPVAGLVCAGMAQAGTLSDVRATLSKMHPGQAVSATASVHSKLASGDKDKPVKTHASMQFRLHAAGGNFRVTYPAALLERLDKEARAQAKDADAPAPLQTLLGSMGVSRLRGLLNEAPSLLRQLQGATLVSTSAGTYADKSVQVMTFKVPSGVSSKDRDDIDHYDGQLKLWVGTDGWPVAVSEARHYKGSKFFIHFSFGQTTTLVLQHVGQRLVAVKAHYRSYGSGMGNRQDTDTRVVLTLAPSSPAIPLK